MYEQVIVGYDASEEAADALAFGRLVAESAGGALTLARAFTFTPFVAEAVGALGPQEEPLLQGEVDRIADELRDVAAVNGADTAVLASTSTVQGLHDLAQERHAGLLVVGSTHRAGLGTVLLGSVGQRLLEGAPCAVAVAPRGFRDRALGAPRVIAVAFDGSPESSHALEAAAELAGRTKATVRLLAVQPPAGRTVGNRLGDRLREARDALPAELRAAAQLLHGQPAAVIAEEAEKGVDVLFVGSRGYGPLRRALLGSVSSALMSSSPCPVIVTPRGSGEAGPQAVQTGQARNGQQTVRDVEQHE